MNESKYYAADTIFKGISLAALLFSGVFGWRQYLESKDRDFRKVIYEKQVAVVSEIYSVFGEFEVAKDDAAKKSAGKKFWVIYYGSARTFLTPKMNASLSELPSEYVASCISDFGKPKSFKDCDTFPAFLSLTGFAGTVRRELGNTWQQDLGVFGAENPWIDIRASVR